jgi:hypothetical protein
MTRVVVTAVHRLLALALALALAAFVPDVAFAARALVEDAVSEETASSSVSFSWSALAREDNPKTTALVVATSSGRTPTREPASPPPPRVVSASFTPTDAPTSSIPTVEFASTETDVRRSVAFDRIARAADAADALGLRPAFIASLFLGVKNGPVSSLLTDPSVAAFAHDAFGDDVATSFFGR